MQANQTPPAGQNWVTSYIELPPKGRLQANGNGIVVAKKGSGLDVVFKKVGDLVRDDATVRSNVQDLALLKQKTIELASKQDKKSHGVIGSIKRFFSSDYAAYCKNTQAASKELIAHIKELEPEANISLLEHLIKSHVPTECVRVQCGSLALSMHKDILERSSLLKDLLFLDGKIELTDENFKIEPEQLVKALIYLYRLEDVDGEPSSISLGSEAFIQRDFHNVISTLDRLGIPFVELHPDHDYNMVWGAIKNGRPCQQLDLRKIFSPEYYNQYKSTEGVRYKSNNHKYCIDDLQKLAKMALKNKQLFSERQLDDIERCLGMREKSKFRAEGSDTYYPQEKVLNVAARSEFRYDNRVWSQPRLNVRDVPDSLMKKAALAGVPGACLRLAGQYLDQEPKDYTRALKCLMLDDPKMQGIPLSERSLSYRDGNPLMESKPWRIFTPEARSKIDEALLPSLDKLLKASYELDLARVEKSLGDAQVGVRALLDEGQDNTYILRVFPKIPPEVLNEYRELLAKTK